MANLNNNSARGKKQEMRINRILTLYTFQPNKNIQASSSILQKDSFEKTGNNSINFGRKYNYLDSTNADHIMTSAGEILKTKVKTEDDLMKAISTRNVQIETALKNLGSKKNGDVMVKIIRMSLGRCPAYKNKFYTQTKIQHHLGYSDSKFKRIKKTAIFLFQQEMGMEPSLSTKAKGYILKRVCPEVLIDAKKNLSEMTKAELLEAVKKKSKLYTHVIKEKGAEAFSEENKKKYQEALQKKYPNMTEEKIKEKINLAQKTLSDKVDNSEAMNKLRDEEFRESIFETIQLIAETIDGTRGRRI